VQTNYITGNKNFTKLFKSVRENQELFTVLFSLSGHTLHFRTLCPENDIQLISHWIDNKAAKRFWDADNSISHLTAVYHETPALSVIASIDTRPSCLIEVYPVCQDELSSYVNCSTQDYGIHFLMAPVHYPIKNLSVSCMQQCLCFLFSFDDVQNIYGEPDIENSKANALVKKAGFRFLKRQRLSYKTANIYICNRRLLNHQTLYMPETHAC
jgi:RimJ/RimL family protein N-acetyltransferase